MDIGRYRFEDPHFFWLLLIIPAMIFWYVYRKKNQFPEQKLPSLSPFAGQPKSWKEILRHVLFAFRVIAIALIIIALARPQTVLDKEKITTEGIDIVIALDISGSMLAKDFKPDRLEAAKEVAAEFIDGRPNDRIGLVVFSGESFTQCPITTDHKVLKNLFKGIKSGMIEPGTAIGHGLATAVDRLKDSPGKSRVIILLTDGENNRGQIDPITASELAKSFGIRVYTVGVGSKGKALSPVAQYPNGKFMYDYVPVNIDEETLKQIAANTGTKYFRATNEDKLREIYKEIDQMEKTKIEVTSFKRYRDRFLLFALIASALLAIEISLKHSIFRNYPS